MTDDLRGKTVLEQLLLRARFLNDRAGFLAWDPDRLLEEPDGDPLTPRLPPATPAEPRLFISYVWEEGEHEQWMDAFAGMLFNDRYGIVYDRDPRNADGRLSAQAVQIRMVDCNVFVPILTDTYIERVAGGAWSGSTWSGATGAAGAEWGRALRLLEEGYLGFIGIWLSGGPLPPPLTPANTVDARSDPDIWSGPIREMFPPPRPGCRGVPALQPAERPPDPAGWPKYGVPG
jgi:hypothetical protein